jgi:N-acetylglucosaminyldiphosphoundecaprenol N-acetyl-beta-D-mannosaminyltransferase
MRRINLFGVELDALDMRGAVHVIGDWLGQPIKSSCRYVVTPNVDHVVMLQDNLQLQAAYQDAALVVADGFPLILASQLLGRPLPERVAGSELVPALFSCLQSRETKTRVFLLGAMPGVADRAAMKIERQWPHVDVVATCSPPLGFEQDDRQCERILVQIEQVQPDLLIVGLGAPKQELWVHRFHTRIAANVVLCVGATIDFLAGEKRQAPIWMRRTGLEWLHRVGSEPRRLARRYALGAYVFPQLFFREWMSSR